MSTSEITADWNDLGGGAHREKSDNGDGDGEIDSIKQTKTPPRFTQKAEANVVNMRIHARLTGRTRRNGQGEFVIDSEQRGIDSDEGRQHDIHTDYGLHFIFIIQYGTAQLHLQI
jgi:hypothetical protein